MAEESELEQQFPREVQGLHSTFLELQHILQDAYAPDDSQVMLNQHLLFITDVSGIARGFNKRYTASPILLDVIVSLSHICPSLVCAWGPGSDKMPADPLSRARLSFTKWLHPASLSSHTWPCQGGQGHMCDITYLQSYIQASVDWYQNEFT